MGLSVFLSLTIIAAIAFTLKEKRLHPFETFFLWMVLSIFIHTFVSLFSLNWKLISLPNQLINYWAFVLLQVTFYPLMIIWGFDHYLRLRSRTKKLIMFMVLISLIVGVEYFSKLLGVIKHVRWTLFSSYTEWFLIILLTFISWSWFRNILYQKE